MKNVKLKSLIAVAFICSALSFIGCDENDVKNTTDNAKQKVQQGIDDSKQKIQDGKDKAADMSKTDFSAQDNAINENYLITELNKKGFEAKKVTATKKPYDEYFSVPQEALKLNGGEISVYQYAENQKSEMMADVNKLITPSTNANGSGGVVKTLPNTHIYHKGRIAVVYEGTDETIINGLSDVLGMPI